MAYFITLMLLLTHGGAAYLGYKKGAKVAALAGQIKTDVQTFKK